MTRYPFDEKSTIRLITVGLFSSDYAMRHSNLLPRDNGILKYYALWEAWILYKFDIQHPIKYDVTVAGALGIKNGFYIDCLWVASKINELWVVMPDVTDKVVSELKFTDDVLSFFGVYPYTRKVRELWVRRV